jgi:nuclear RNA export factor
MVGRVIERTRLNVQFAVDCLQNNGWNVDVAVANFEHVKVSWRSSVIGCCEHVV